MVDAPSRASYRLFSPFEIGSLHLKNRIVRSATWDPMMVFSRRVDEQTIEIYRDLARGGAGMLIVGDFDAIPGWAGKRGLTASEPDSYNYGDVRIEGFSRLANVVHEEEAAVAVVAQVGVHVPGKAVSAIPSPFTGRIPEALSATEIEAMAECLAVAIEGVRDDGFDGVQLHAAHGGLLCRFLSPYSNRRNDAYGGSPERRTRLFADILDRARRRVGAFPILIKLNGTDYLDGGIDRSTLARQAALLAAAGIDALEISGGMHEALLQPEEELGFPPVPAAESHTRIADPEKQSYFLPFAQAIDVNVPIILTGGNRDAERVEGVLQKSNADLIGLSRPLIREPDLPDRWLRGGGAPTASCVSCNACIFDMHTAIGSGRPGHTRCLVDTAPERLAEAARWLAGWADRARAEAGDCG